MNAKHHPHVDRRGAGARAQAIVAGHSLACAEFGNDPLCPGPPAPATPALDAAARADMPVLIREVERLRARAHVEHEAHERTRAELQEARLDVERLGAERDAARAEVVKLRAHLLAEIAYREAAEPFVWVPVYQKEQSEEDRQQIEALDRAIIALKSFVETVEVACHGKEVADAAGSEKG